MKTALPIACAVVALILFTLASSSRALWNPDEPREAEIAREMWRSGDAVVPHLNGDPFLEKPPLYAWLCGLAFRLRGGPDPAGARLPSSVAGAALVGLTVRLGLTALPARHAVLAGAALAGMPLYWWHASRANLDIPLALFVGLAVAGFYRAWTRSRSPGAPRTGTYHHPALDAAACAAAMAMLTKGLVGLALPVLIVFAFLALERDFWFLARLRWVRLTVILAAPVLCWLVPFARRDGGALAHTMFVKHHLERFASGFDHQNPWWHYGFTLPTSTLPWCFLALPAVLDRQTSSPLRTLCLAWILAPFLFFSASASKRDLYLLPSFPAVALLVGLGAQQVGRGARVAAACAGLAGLAIAGALGPLAPKAIHPALATLREAHAWLLPLLVVTWSLAALGLCVRGGFAFAAAPTLLTAALALGWVFPTVDPLKSPRAIMPALRSITDLVGYRLREPDMGILDWERDTPIEIASEPEDVPALLAQGRRVLASETTLMPALAASPVAWRVMASASSGSDRFVIVERDPRERPSGAASARVAAGRKVALTLRCMVH